MTSIVSRSRWGSRLTNRTRMPLPAKRLWLHHTATNAWHGPGGVRACQAFHMDARRYKDIAYNFLVDTDGTIYEGRGVGYVGGHTEGDNDESHAICAMGDFSSIDPPAVMLQSIADLTVHGFREGWWPNQITGGHKDAPGAQTACPGGRLHVRLADLNRAIAAQLAKEDDMPTPTTIVDALVAPDGKGVWLLQYDGGVVTKNGAPFLGSYPGLPPEARRGERHFVAIEPHQGGYLLLADDGALYRFPARRAA